MTTLYEKYITGDDANFAFYASSPSLNWNCMTFTPSTDFIVYSMKAKLLRFDAGSTPGILTSWILPTTGGVPTGSALVTGTLSAAIANAITTTSPGEWKEVVFTSRYLLRSGTVYGVALKSSTDDTSHPIYWRYDTNDGAYTNGRKYTSSDGGTIWTGSDPDDDFMFEIWGNPQGSGGAGGSIFPSDAVARVSSIRHIFRPGFFRMQVGLGDLGLDIDIAETAVRAELDTAKKIEEAPPEEVAREPYPFTPPEVMQPLYEAEAKRQQVLAEELGIAAPTARTIRIQVEEADKIAILQEIERLSRSAMATGITPYARNVLQRAIKRKQDELEALYRRNR